MFAEDPCSEMVIEVRSFQLRRAWGVELILAPSGYERIISSGLHDISLQELCLGYRNTRTGLSSACQTLVRDSLLWLFPSISTPCKSGRPSLCHSHRGLRVQQDISYWEVGMRSSSTISSKGAIPASLRKRHGLKKARL